MDFGSSTPDHGGWVTLASETHYEDAHVRVATEDVRTPRAERSRRWTVVHRKAAVVIAPFRPDGKLLLIRQERIPIRAQIWEVPAGQIDNPDEQELAAISAVALRELREETGYELGSTGEIVPLGGFYSSPGFTDEHAHFFLARGVVPAAGGHAHAEGESIAACHAFAPHEIAAMISSNEIRDANTLSICAMLVARGYLSLES